MNAASHICFNVTVTARIGHISPGLTRLGEVKEQDEKIKEILILGDMPQRDPMLLSSSPSP